MNNDIKVDTKSVMLQAIILQCAGMISLMVFQNGFIIAYLTKFQISNSDILKLISIPHIASFLLLIPFAFLSDQYGKKKIGTTGLLLTVVGYFILMFGSFDFGGLLSGAVICALGITCYGIGSALFTSNWFALLKPIIPAEIRGRFFGKLRASWQLVAIMFTAGVTLVLKENDSLSMYLVILGIIVILLVVRIIYYQKIPENQIVDQAHSEEQTFLESLKFVFRIPNYLPFCCYLFLLMLFIGAFPAILNLLQKEYFNYSGDQIVLMGILLSLGSLIGFYYGGKIVDSYGTRPVFLLNHIMFFVVILLILTRAMIPLPLIITMGALTAVYGFGIACSSIASTSEMLALVPNEHISLSTALNLSMVSGGISLSGILSAKLLDLNILNTQWWLFGNPMNEFDAILLICGAMIILLVVTLGLIPSVSGQAQYFPISRL
ncbi:MAG: MFS transporter [Proteobacteria bacterium]|nr:MFS transporter [Pseudomonadota bacterium]